MYKIKLFIFACLTVLSNIVLFSCSEEPITPEVSVAEGTVDYFTETMDFPSTGGSKILNFTSNVKWTLAVSKTQSAASWCTVSQSEGAAGTYNVSVTVGENAGYDDRNVVLVLTAGKLKKNIIVNQKQKNAMTLTTDRFEVGKEGGTINVEVKANVNYSVEIPEAYKRWISQASQTRAVSARTLSFNIAESKEYDKREGEIKISSGDITETVKIYQSGSAILILSQNEFTLSSEGGTVSIDVSSNFEFEVDMPDVDWVKAADKTRAVSSHTLVYNVSPNTSYDNREAVIVFKDAYSGKKESVTIKQKQKNAIILSDNKVEIAQEGGIFSVNVNSNVNYSIEIPSSCSSWLSRTSAPSSAKTKRALSKTVPYFKVSNSENYDKREGEIIFRHNDITEIFKVYQSGGAVLVLNQDTYNIEGGATTISIQLKSNIDYTVSVSNDWISEVSTRAVSISTRNFNIATNKTGKSRTGKITFRTSDGKKSATVTITQATIVKANSLTVSFTNTSGTTGGNLFIGKNYGFKVAATPSNAVVDYEWKVEDTSIASISGNGSGATLYTRNYGQSKVIVTEKNSGMTATYDFGTAVTDFTFTETSRETQYGYPVITIAVGGTYQLKYTCNPSYATKVFGNLKAFNFKEIDASIGSYVIVDKSSIVDIDANGLITAKKIGTTIINANNGYGVRKSGSNDGVFVKVVKEISPYGTIGGHSYVDLGLPSGKLWATSNFGAYSETEYGSYYLWSSTDMVPSSWGTKWNTPTREEFNELLNNCTYSWTSKNGVNGYLFTGKNNATMFLPASGFKMYTEGYGFSNVQSGGTWLMYWTTNSSGSTWEGQGFAYAFQGSSESVTTNGTYNITVTGATIRPISR